MYTNEELGVAIANAVFSTTIAKSKTIELKMADFPINAILAMLSHGAQRKFNDAVGGKERDGKEYTAEQKVADAEALIADFKNGVVSKRREGGSAVSVEVKVGRSLMRAIFGQKLDDAGKAKFKAMTAEEQNAALDKNVASAGEAFATSVAAEVARLAKERAAKDKLAGGVSVTL